MPGVAAIFQDRAAEYLRAGDGKTKQAQPAHNKNEKGKNMSEPMEIEVNGEVYHINGKGDVQDDNETVQVTAAQLERIYKTSVAMRAACRGQLKETAGDGHPVDFFGNDEVPMEPGDVYIGCQHVTHAQIVQAVKASRKQRGKRSLHPKGKK